MALRYERFAGQPSRLGKFERYLGQMNMDAPPALDLTLTDPAPISSSVMGGSTAAGDSIGNVLTGVGAILNPLATVGGAFLSAKIQSDADKKLMKMQLQQQQQQQQAALAAAMAAAQQPTQSSATPIILAILGGTALLAVVMITVMKKKG